MPGENDNKGSDAPSDAIRPTESDPSLNQIVEKTAKLEPLDKVKLQTKKLSEDNCRNNK